MNMLPPKVSSQAYINKNIRGLDQYYYIRAATLSLAVLYSVTAKLLDH